MTDKKLWSITGGIVLNIHGTFISKIGYKGWLQKSSLKDNFVSK